jgi:type VI secretion system protein ImpA
VLTPSPAYLDFDRLVAPISSESPCGESLRWEPVWDELSSLRKTRKDPLDASADKEPEWDKVVSLATEQLATKSKDLLISGWLAEALLRTNGFAGLRDGIKLVRLLCERFWDQIHPLPEGGDLSVRAAPLSWLMSHDGGARLPAVIREAPVAPASGGAVMNWYFWNLRRAAPQGKDEKEDAFKKRNQEAEQKRLQFDSAVETAPIVYYQTLLADIDAGVAELDGLVVILDQRLADQSPSASELKKAIAEIRVFVYDVLKRRGGLPAAAATAAEPVAEQAMSANGAADTSKSNNHAGPPRSRAEAIARLDEAARYFSEAEPHSPVAYLVRRAIRWADMPFAEVLGELVKDDKLVKQIGETLGIPSK